MEKTIQDSFALVFKIIKEIKYSQNRTYAKPISPGPDMLCSNHECFKYWLLWGAKWYDPQKFLQKLQSYCCEKKPKSFICLTEFQ